MKKIVKKQQAPKSVCKNCDNMDLHLDEQCPECGKTASDARADKAVAKIMSKPTLEGRQAEFMNQVSNILKF